MNISPKNKLPGYKWLTLFVIIAGVGFLAWHQYRTHFGRVMVDSGDSAKSQPRIIIREFLDPILPDEDGIYRLEYWNGGIMQECVSFYTDSFRASSARIEWGTDGSSAWLDDRKVGLWNGRWLGH